MKRLSTLMKITIIILPTFIIAMSTILCINYRVIKDVKVNEINQEMNARLSSALIATSKQLTSNARVSQALAKVIGTSHQIYTKDNYIALLKDIITINKDTLGSGMFFEPYMFDEDVYFFGPYAYKQDSKNVYTDDLSEPDYNYFGFQWYKIGFETDQEMVWSEPFYDVLTKLNLVTAVSKVVDAKGRIIGIATADLDLENLQNALKDIKIGSTGKAMLFQKNGTYIVTDDINKIFKLKIQEESNASLAKAGRLMMQSKMGMTTYEDKGSKYRLYYSTIPEMDWILSLSISEDELLNPVNKLLYSNIIITLLFMAIVAVITYLSIYYINKTQKQMHESEKMATLGRLVAGIAHEINTPLGIGITTASFIDKINHTFNEKLKANTLTKNDLMNFTKDLEDSIALMNTNLSRTADSVMNFKRFAVNLSSDNKLTFNLKECIDLVIIGLKHEYKKSGHKIHNHCPEDLVLSSYMSEFSHVFTNLIMDSIRHGFEEKENGHIDISVFVQGNLLKIVYADDGNGIPADQQKKIFDPFHTVNRKAGCSGLGLSITYNFVTQKLKGRISFESNQPKGVKFTIEIPRKELNV